MPDLKVVNIVNQEVQRRGDIVMTLNDNGTFLAGPLFVSGINRAVQDFVKGVLTRLGSNSLARNYGTGIKDLLHSRKLNNVASQIVSDIQFLLGYLGRFNINAHPSERIDELVSLKAKENLDIIELDITLRVGTGDTVGVKL